MRARAMMCLAVVPATMTGCPTGADGDAATDGTTEAAATVATTDDGTETETGTDSNGPGTHPSSSGPTATGETETATGTSDDTDTGPTGCEGPSDCPADEHFCENGPAPNRLVPIKHEMVRDGLVVERKKQFHRVVQMRLVPLREANLDLFTANEIALVDEIIDALRGRTADAVGDVGRPLPACELADNEEIIPYYAALLAPPEWEPDQQVLDEAARLAARL